MRTSMMKGIVTARSNLRFSSSLFKWFDLIDQINTQCLICFCIFLEFWDLCCVKLWHLYYKKLCSRWVPKMLMDIHKQTIWKQPWNILRMFFLFFRGLLLAMIYEFAVWYQEANSNHCSGSILILQKPRIPYSSFYKKNHVMFLRLAVNFVTRIHSTNHNNQCRS